MEQLTFLELPTDESPIAPGVIGRSPLMRELFRVVRAAAGVSAPVLIEGESGTGKELVARAIHLLGNRRDQPFLAVNCGALAESLLDSELFGHRAGAFTGAIRDRAGLLESAEGGTLFLDEIGEVSPALQVKLLRALQQGEILRIGDNAPRRFDARVVAATNRSLREEVAAGRFREDLFYRLHVIPLWVPPLRDRPEDIPLLVAHFLRRRDEREGGGVRAIEAEALRALSSYPWPGNVRELENELERALTLAGDSVELTVEMLSRRVRAPRTGGRRGAGDLLQHRLEGLESELIQDALDRMGGNKTRAALHLGVSRQGLYKKMARLGLTRGDG